MIRRRQTISELRWPETDEFMAISKDWCETASINILTFVWKGYDLLVNEVFSEIDCSQAEDDIERDITQLLEPEIRSVMTGDEPYYVQHGSYERETRQVAPAQPKEYDIAFILRKNRRIIWPLEAKVLKTDGAVGEYVKEINENFITCKYAPFYFSLHTLVLLCSPTYLTNRRSNSLKVKQASFSSSLFLRALCVLRGSFLLYPSKFI